MLQVISAQCVAHDLHTIAPGSLQHSEEMVENLELRLSMQLLLLLYVVVSAYDRRMLRTSRSFFFLSFGFFFFFQGPLCITIIFLIL